MAEDGKEVSAALVRNLEVTVDVSAKSTELELS